MTSFWGSKVVIRAAKIPIRPPKRVSKKGSFGPLGPLRSGSEGLISGYEVLIRPLLGTSGGVLRRYYRPSVHEILMRATHSTSRWGMGTLRH